MEVIEVIDSAVKIGLGALISGFATYFVAKINHSAAISKEVIAKKMTMLNDAAELAEVFFYYNTRRLNVVGGHARHVTVEDQPMSQRQQQDVKKTDENIVEILATRNKALAKLQLLQLAEAEEALRAYSLVSTELRELITHKKIMPTTAQLEGFGERLVEQKNRYYKALSVGLNSL